jgi:hypothetical protein
MTQQRGFRAVASRPFIAVYIWMLNDSLCCGGRFSFVFGQIYKDSMIVVVVVFPIQKTFKNFSKHVEISVEIWYNEKKAVWQRQTLILEGNGMKWFDALFGAERRETMLLKKQDRAVAIVASYTPPEEITANMTDSDAPNFGVVIFKYRRNDKWIQHRVILREDIGDIEEGDQWIIKFDENFTRIMSVHIPLSPDSPYRLVEDEE